jgi:hypothetical protein
VKLLLLSVAHAGWSPMPGAPLLASPTADPRATRLHVSWRPDGNVDAALGQTVPLVQYSGPVKVQAGLLFGTWLRFQQGGPGTFDLHTFDGSFGVPVDVELEHLVVRLAWRHTSAHIADGLDRPSITWSREEAQLLTRTQVGPLELYAGASWMWRTTPELPRLGTQLGLESQGTWWFASADLQLRAEDGWSPGLAAFAGLRVQGGRGPVLRLGPCAALGPDRRGQLHRSDDPYVGVRLDLDLLPRGRAKTQGRASPK